MNILFLTFLYPCPVIELFVLTLGIKWAMSLMDVDYVVQNGTPHLLQQFPISIAFSGAVVHMVWNTLWPITKYMASLSLSSSLYLLLDTWNTFIIISVIMQDDLINHHDDMAAWILNYDTATRNYMSLSLWSYMAEETGVPKAQTLDGRPLSCHMLRPNPPWWQASIALGQFCTTVSQ